ncbi:Transmembrane protein 244 [Lonchura striata]|uniref:Transmembrane protein 244 n=1 Tax=Lonchura striata TaxID=40157 RepID=A0A218V7H3_9PASE|nr:Transmembrane protein 244 [Lonchura striata domestica]
MLDGLAPFDFKTNPSWINPYYLAMQQIPYESLDSDQRNGSHSTNGNFALMSFKTVFGENILFSFTVLVISLEITFFLCGLLFALVVEEWVWDYAVTVTIIHIIITSAVMSEFPLMLHWWLALGSGVISMICGGQILAYCLFKDNFIYPILDDF